MINICKRSVKRAILQSYNIVVGLYKLRVPSSTTAGLDYSSQLSSAGCRSGGILYGIEWESGSCVGGRAWSISWWAEWPRPLATPLPAYHGRVASASLDRSAQRLCVMSGTVPCSFPASPNLTCYWTLFTKIAWLHLVFAHSSIVFLVIID